MKPENGHAIDIVACRICYVRNCAGLHLLVGYVYKRSCAANTLFRQFSSFFVIFFFANISKSLYYYEPRGGTSTRDLILYCSYFSTLHVTRFLDHSLLQLKGRILRWWSVFKSHSLQMTLTEPAVVGTEPVLVGLIFTDLRWPGLAQLLDE